jgi:hypothetical protein
LRFNPVVPNAGANHLHLFCAASRRDDTISPPP